MFIVSTPQNSSNTEWIMWIAVNPVWFFQVLKPNKNFRRQKKQSTKQDLVGGGGSGVAMVQLRQHDVNVFQSGYGRTEVWNV